MSFMCWVSASRSILKVSTPTGSEHAFIAPAYRDFIFPFSSRAEQNISRVLSCFSMAYFSGDKNISLLLFVRSPLDPQPGNRRQPPFAVPVLSGTIQLHGTFQEATRHEVTS